MLTDCRENKIPKARSVFWLTCGRFVFSKVGLLTAAAQISVFPKAMWWVEVNSGVRVPGLSLPSVAAVLWWACLSAVLTETSPQSSIKMPELETQQNSSQQLLRVFSEETGS